MKLRSSLVTPALQVQFVKALEVGADAAITDLEDSIPEAKKDEARRRAFAPHRMPELALTRCLRINSPTTPHGIKDLAALLESKDAPDVIHIPKVEAPEHVLMVESALKDKHPGIRYFAIIETAKGLSRALEIAQSTKSLEALIFGAGDFARDINVDIAWGNLAFARHAIVLAAAGAGIQAIDSPCFEIHNSRKLAEECNMARQMGFSGKIAIHPGQVETINQSFGPDQLSIEHARAIVEKSSQTDESIFVVNGHMIGPPIVHQAREMLSRYMDLTEH
ncbi:MAG: CoA ester lyase [Bdellovibrionaceae bacterium]|nr:CoA ester lyase [Bdellovibrionales bacterium]MCB9254026.1 CoA ester lyase [Pseudobdellovibrionaceae bacterium]